MRVYPYTNEDVPLQARNLIVLSLATAIIEGPADFFLN
jgi:hypothetical protein